MITTVTDPFAVQYRIAADPTWRPLKHAATLLDAAMDAAEVFEVDFGAIVATRFLDVDGTVLGGCGAAWNQA